MFDELQPSVRPTWSTRSITCKCGSRRRRHRRRPRPHSTDRIATSEANGATARRRPAQKVGRNDRVPVREGRSQRPVPVRLGQVQAVPRALSEARIDRASSRSPASNPGRSGREGPRSENTPKLELTIIGAGRPGPHPDRGRARRRQDDAGEEPGARDWAAPSSASSSRPTCCRATSPASRSTTSAPASSSSAPGRSSPRWCWPTRSTAPRPRRSRRCSKRWRSSRSPSTA